MRTASEKVTLLGTDGHAGYADLIRDSYRISPPHAWEYVRGKVHTNSMESFSALLKRRVMGTYINVSVKYLPLYLNEFMFGLETGERRDVR